MERATLDETCGKLALFAAQLGTSDSQLTETFARDWLPQIRVVALPDELRPLDPRALAVRELDRDDYPSAALASLLSPCVVLTHNFKHFRPLGLEAWSQGIDATVAAIDLTTGEMHLQAVAAVPVLPALAVGAGARWAASRIGAIVWIALGLVMLTGIAAYRDWPSEKKESFKKGLGDVGLGLLKEFSEASAHVADAQQRLEAYATPGLEDRTAVAMVVRQLAIAEESMSAQRLYDLLDEEARPSVQSLRALLHAYKQGVFQEVRRGGFVLGYRYELRAAQ